MEANFLTATAQVLRAVPRCFGVDVGQAMSWICETNRHACVGGECSAMRWTSASLPESDVNICALPLPIKKYQGKLPLKRGLNDMTSLATLPCNRPPIAQIRERADGAGF
jgi:hypothetical protein